jgi:hypothetical protein
LGQQHFYQGRTTLLQDWTLSPEEFFRLLKLQPATMRVRAHTGDAAFAFGLKRNPHPGAYLPLDALAVLLTSLLSTQISLRPAAEIIRVSWDAWLRAVQVAEGDPKLYEGSEVPVELHMYIGVGVSKGKLGRCEVGTMIDIMPKLNTFEAVRGISIQLALRQLRANSRKTGVALPDRLTVPFDHADHAKWRQEIEDYRKLANMRFKAKLKAKKAGARAKEIA